MKILQEVPPKVPNNTYTALDSEWFRLNSNQMHRPISGQFAALTICYDPEVVYLITNPKDVPAALNAIDDCIWLIHHSKFDLTHIRRLAVIPPRSKLIDTMLMDMILWRGYYEHFGLADLARRYLGVFVDKSYQEKFETGTELTPELIDYACNDANILLKIWAEQRKLITKTDMKIWREIDLPTLWAVMDFKGFRIDKDRWLALAQRNKDRQLEIDANLPFNPRSPKQVVNHLKSVGAKNIQDSQEKTLDDLIRKHPDTEYAKLAALILESRGYGKRASTYGERFLNDYVEQEAEDVWFIHTDYHLNGSETSRFSSSSPNMQNIPIRDTLEFRECFIARPNHKLIIADYSAQEFGIMAWFAQDKKMMEIFNSGEDVYILMAKEMYHKIITKEDKIIRNRMKSTILGVDYGMSAQGLAHRESITIDEAEEILAMFRKTFPQVAKYMDKQKKQKRVVQTVLGRKIWLNPYSGQCERNALNAPIQGSASEMLKRAISEMHKQWNFDYPFAVVEVTHDEIGVDVPDAIAEDVKIFMETIMAQVANTMMSGMNFKAIATICDSWAGKD